MVNVIMTRRTIDPDAEAERDRRIPWLDENGDLTWKLADPDKAARYPTLLIGDFTSALDRFNRLRIKRGSIFTYEPRKLPGWKPTQPTRQGMSDEEAGPRRDGMTREKLTEELKRRYWLDDEQLLKLQEEVFARYKDDPDMVEDAWEAFWRSLFDVNDKAEREYLKTVSQEEIDEIRSGEPETDSFHEICLFKAYDENGEEASRRRARKHLRKKARFTQRMMREFHEGQSLSETTEAAIAESSSECASMESSSPESSVTSSSVTTSSSRRRTRRNEESGA
jgi:hypothetical protein